ncbi:hypothetical protein GHT06_012524 [Daphnia sinensis]|uniref:Nucleoplasmin-like domain-containing protein n=1 Tax=Daphnia sinensis TaxID=1820382 RepID=A0AAD5LF38_9CRUS|nr:hypothetical protein GHT06_012524 [Daphnia sinensis]
MQACPSDRSFWGMAIQPGIKHSFTVERPLHVSKATIDIRSIMKKNAAVTSLLVDSEDYKEIVLCNLYMTQGLTCPSNYKSLKPEADLNLYFKAGQKITFFSAKHVSSESGLKEAVIHLSGYQL